jgi:hypothetical protein
MSTPITSQQQQAPGQPFVRQRLRDLPTPPEVAAEARRIRKKQGWGAQRLCEIEDQLKLQYYYGGQYLRCLFGREGPIVVVIYRGDDEDYRNQVEALSPQERQKAVIVMPARWNDPNAQITGYTHHESQDPS